MKLDLGMLMIVWVVVLALAFASKGGARAALVAILIFVTFAIFKVATPGVAQ